MKNLGRGQGGSAAPFSRGTRKANPKLPGRKLGEGPFLRREEPAGASTETIAAPVEACCPHCRGALEPDGTEFASVTDMVEITASRSEALRSGSVPLPAVRMQGARATRGSWRQSA